MISEYIDKPEDTTSDIDYLISEYVEKPTTTDQVASVLPTQEAPTKELPNEQENMSKYSPASVIPKAQRIDTNLPKETLMETPNALYRAGQSLVGRTKTALDRTGLTGIGADVLSYAQSIPSPNLPGIMPIEKETAKKYGIYDISKYTSGENVDIDKINKDLASATPFEKQHIQSLAKNYLNKKIARKTIKDVSTSIKESIPEKTIQNKEENDAFASNVENWKKAISDPDAAYKLSESLIDGAIANAGNLVVSFLNPVAGAGAMVAQEAEGWDKNAEASGIDDEAIRWKYKNIYAAPAGIAEFAMSRILTKPVRAALKVIPGASQAVEKVSQEAEKSVVKKVLASLLKTTGNASMEGLEEVTQDMLSDIVLVAALNDMAQKHPERAIELKEKANKINLEPFTKQRFGTFLYGAGIGGVTSGVSQAAGATLKQITPSSGEIDRSFTVTQGEAPTTQEPIQPPFTITKGESLEPAAAKEAAIPITEQSLDKEASTVQAPTAEQEDEGLLKLIQEALNTKEEFTIEPEQQPVQEPVALEEKAQPTKTETGTISQGEIDQIINDVVIPEETKETTTQEPVKSITKEQPKEFFGRMENVPQNFVKPLTNIAKKEKIVVDGYQDSGIEGLKGLYNFTIDDGIAKGYSFTTKTPSESEILKEKEKIVDATIKDIASKAAVRNIKFPWLPKKWTGGDLPMFNTMLEGKTKEEISDIYKSMKQDITNVMQEITADEMLTAKADATGSIGLLDDLYNKIQYKHTINNKGAGAKQAAKRLNKFLETGKVNNEQDRIVKERFDDFINRVNPETLSEYFGGKYSFGDISRSRDMYTFGETTDSVMKNMLKEFAGYFEGNTTFTTPEELTELVSKVADENAGRTKPEDKYQEDIFFQKKTATKEPTDTTINMFEGTEYADQRTETQKKIDGYLKEREAKKKPLDTSDLPLFNQEKKPTEEQLSLFRKKQQETTQEPESAQRKEVVSNLSKIPKNFQGKLLFRISSDGLGENDNGSATYDQKINRAVIQINPNLEPSKISRLITHEVMGHVGASSVIKSNQKIYNQLMNIFDKRQNTELVNKIRRAYNESGMSDQQLNDIVFTEWIAFSVEDYIENRRPTFAKKVYDLVKELLVSIGVKEADADMVIKDLVKQIHKANIVEPKPSIVKYQKEVMQKDIEQKASKHRGLLTNVRGGWTKPKIQKELKTGSFKNLKSTWGIAKEISNFDSLEEFKNNIYYHGTQSYLSESLKPSIVFSDRDIERIGGGGYGEKYWAISLTKSKKTAESFSGQSRFVNVYPVILKEGSVVKEMPEIKDASDLEDVVESLWNDGVDAVWIGGGEQELAVLNPRAIAVYKNPDNYAVYGGFKSIPLTESQIKELYNKSKEISTIPSGKEFEQKRNELDKLVFQKKLDKDTITVDGKERPTTNSNGKPIAQTEEGLRNFWKWFGDSKVVDEKGRPLVVYHGTTNIFNVFEREKANPASDMGAGLYFTNTQGDVGSNYAGRGPDLTNKIQLMAERIASETDREYDDPDVIKEVEEKFVLHEGATIPAYLEIKKPVVIGKKLSKSENINETFFEMSFNEETEEDFGTMVDFIESLRNVSGEFYDIDIETTIDDILSDFDGYISASNLIDKIKSSEGTAFATMPNGELASSEVARRAFEDIGFDGIIDRTVNAKFGSERKQGKKMVGMNKNTIHYIVFSPTKIKSATGNTGAFSPENPDIRYQKNLEAEPFYSPTLRAVQNLKMEKGTGEQMLAMISKTPGVKEAELKWIGIDDFLKGKKIVSKKEIEEFVRENEIKLSETTESGNLETYPSGTYMNPDTGSVDTYENWYKEAENYYNEYKDDEDINPDTPKEAMNKLEDVSGKPTGKESNVKYLDYQLPGGENYREVLMTIPWQSEETKYRDYLENKYGMINAKRNVLEDKINKDELIKLNELSRSSKMPQKYKSSHWDEPNVIAHTRLNDRTDLEGNRVLFVEEIQSDWAREAREKGVNKSKEEIKKEMQDLGWIVVATEFDRSKSIEAPGNKGFQAKLPYTYQTASIAKTESEAWDNLINSKDQGVNSGVPNQPFLKNWDELVLKRILRMAAEEGYDKVAWINGEQTADRYNLSKMVSEIAYWKQDDGRYGISALDLNGRPIDSMNPMEDLTPQQLETVIGKEPARKIIEDEGEHNPDDSGYLNKGKLEPGVAVLQGENLKIGGEWASSLYDRMIPKFYEKYGKKWGTTVETIELPEIGKQQAISITPEMKRSVMEEGQPLFQKELKEPTREQRIMEAIKGRKKTTAEKFQKRYYEIQQKLQERESKSDLVSMQDKQLSALRGDIYLFLNEYEQKIEELETELDIEKQKNEIAKLTEDVTLNMRDLIREYAIKAGYLKVIPKYLSEVKTLKGLLKSLDLIDKAVIGTTQKKMLGKIKDYISKAEKIFEKQSKAGKKAKIAQPYVEQFRKYVDDLLNKNVILNPDQIIEKQESGETLTETEKKILSIQNSIDNGEEVSDQDRHWLAMVLNPKLTEMSVSQLESVFENMKSILTTGRALTEEEFDKKKAAIRDKANEAAQEIVASMKKPQEKAQEGPRVPETSSTTSKYQGGLKRFGRAFHWDMIRPENIFEWFTGNFEMAGAKKSAFKRYTFDRLLKAENDKIRNVDMANKKLDEIFKDIKKGELYDAKHTVSRATATGREDQLLALNDLMHIYAHSRNEGGTRHLSGNGYDAETIAEVSDILSKQYPESIKAIEDLQEHYDTVQYPRMNEVFMDVYGYPMPKVENYFPILDLETEGVNNDIVQNLLQGIPEYKATVQKGNVKARVRSKRPFKRTDFMGSVYRNKQATEHYIAYEQAINEVRSILENSELKKAMMEKSPEATQQITQLVKDLAAGKIPQSTGALNKAADYMRKNFAVYALGLNLRTMALQMTALATGAQRNNKIGMLNVARQIIYKYPSMRAAINEMSPYMKTRADKIQKEQEELLSNLDKAKFIGKAGDALEAVKKGSMLPMQIMDGISSTIIWKSKFDDVLSKTGDVNRAIELADMQVRRTQASSSMSDLPGMFRRSGLYSMFSMFKNELNQRYNMLWSIAQAAGSKEVSQGQKIIYATEVLASILIASTLEYMLFNGFDLDRLEDDWESIAKQFMSNFYAAIPMANEFIDYGLQNVVNRVREAQGKGSIRTYTPTGGTPVYEPLKIGSESLKNLIESSSKFQQGDSKAALDKLVKSGEEGARAISILTGIPASSIIKSAKAIYSGKPEKIFWSETQLEDRSVNAAMVKRLNSSDPVKNLAFKKWYNKISTEEQEEFKLYYNENNEASFSESKAKANDRVTNAVENWQKQKSNTTDKEKIDNLNYKIKLFIEQKREP